MILIYLDESGTNYKNKDGLYLDGPFLIFGAMFVYEDVYWSLERLFCQLIDKYFGIENWLNQEVHATDIWAGIGLSSGLKPNERREFFDQFLQLCGKLGLHYVFSFNLKHGNRNTIVDKNLDLIRAADSLLTGIEHNLAEIHQTGVLVCDATTGSENLKTKDIANIDINQKSLSSAEALLKEFYAMTSWRSTKGECSAFTFPPKYQMEAMSVYLIDRVHFLPSNDSLFLQMCDILTFVMQRSLVHDYLLCVAKDRMIPDKVPITKGGLSMMKSKIHPATYSDEANDVYFIGVEPRKGLLFDFAAIDPYPEQLKKHYLEMQPTQK